MHGNFIRILEKDNNRRGDLFGRLMADLFVALGYEQPRLNVHKSGRELDLSAEHRLEPRRAIAECKATAQPIGGDDINKFVGALDAEQNDKHPVSGYFISLSGFTETAIEQEKKRASNKVILVTGTQAVDALVEGRILIPKERATEVAGRCRAELGALVLDLEVELLAHERGWIWAIYFTQGKARTHFTLIHSDGTPLARVLADEVIASDRECNGQFHRLVCLNPTPPSREDSESSVAQALAAYRKYLENECGFIQLDGLPADAEVGSRRLILENLFVPLHLDLAPAKIVIEAGQKWTEAIDAATKDAKSKRHQPVGAVLGEHSRLALLAAPGGGKSTLLKRLAVAYADPNRRERVTDGLPDRDWLPLFFRCRELRDLARGSFAELLEALSQREPVRQQKAVFRAYADQALLAGRVLLLVDGLDEISDAGDRAAFVCTLRAALQAYPGIGLVVTSREAGFRHVAAHLAAVCTQATLSPFDSGDIRRLSVAWHREVMGDTEKVKADAEQLAETIMANDRIRSLAVNPLLLTTLLLVRRWLGSLPTRRAALYGKAVELLLMTWNVEGHEPIQQEEALPQLCYAASAMMLDGVQKISRPRLAALLREARKALPMELGYVKGRVEEFIQRVEERSSLLMMSGHDVEDGQLVEFFEFRHLTFQEFLTARAMVEGWHPGRKETDTLASVLEPHFAEEEWREVIPLAASLRSKGTEGLLQTLTQRASQEPESRGFVVSPVVRALGSCLADEAAARRETIQAALREIVWRGLFLGISDGVAKSLATGRYGTDLREEAGKLLLAERPFLAGSAVALAYCVFSQTMVNNGESQAARRFEEMLAGTDRLARCEGALGLQRLCLQLSARPGDVAACADSLQRSALALVPMLFSEGMVEQYVASWALVWVGVCRIWMPPSTPDVLGRLFELWRGSSDSPGVLNARWALTSQPLGPRDEGRCASVPLAESRSLLAPERYVELGSNEKLGALIVAWYLRAVSDEDITRLTLAHLKEGGGPLEAQPEDRTLRELLERLGVKPEEIARAESA